MNLSKNLQLVITLVIISGVILILESSPSEVFVEDKEIMIGQAPPLFTLESLDGGFVSLEEYRGRPIMVNFWASWCEPCTVEMPDFEEASNTHDGLVIIGVNLQETRGDAQRFANQVGVTYPLVLDPNGRAKQSYDVFTQPVTIFIDSEFNVVSRKNGLLTRPELESRLEEIL